MNPIGAAQRWSIYVTSGVLLVTGLLWTVLHYFPATLSLDEGATLAFKAFLMKIHGAAAMAALILLGFLLAKHVSPGLAAKHNKASGVATLLVFSILAVTGYSLYYAGDEGNRQLASIIHLFAGLSFSALLTSHGWRVADDKAQRHF